MSWSCGPRVERDVGRAIFYLGRFGMIVGMWLLLVDVVTAGPMGPNARLFGVGVLVFLSGWGLTKAITKQ